MFRIKQLSPVLLSKARFSDRTYRPYPLTDMAATGYAITAVGCGLYAANDVIVEFKKEDHLAKAIFTTVGFLGGLVFGPPYLVLATVTWPFRANRK